MPSIQLSIAEPCHENWNDMLPEEKGRFCLSCQKTVIDFTQMSDRQVFEYFKNYNGNTCGQLLPTQLDREISKPKTHSIGRWKYFWQILLPAVFAFHKAEAQKVKGEVAPKVVCKQNNEMAPQIVMGKIMRPVQQLPAYRLLGVLTDEQNNRLASASIISNNGSHTISDSLGQFSIIIKRNETLTISYVGFQSQQISFDSIKALRNSKIEINAVTNTTNIHLPIQLKQAAIDSNIVVVAGYINNALTGRMGGISVRRSITIFSKPSFAKTVPDTPKLVVFPNPIQRGQNFQISLQLKKIGNLTLQIVDASGQLLAIEKFYANNLHFTKTVNGNALQQAGIYFINILSADNKKGKAITGKIVVQ